MDRLFFIIKALKQNRLFCYNNKTKRGYIWQVQVKATSPPKWKIQTTKMEISLNTRLSDTGISNKGGTFIVRQSRLWCKRKTSKEEQIEKIFVDCGTNIELMYISDSGL